MTEQRGFVQLASSNAAGFINSLSNDLLIYTTSNSQQILIGNQNTNASLVVTSNAINVSGSINFTGDLKRNGVIFESGGGGIGWSSNANLNTIFTMSNVGIGTNYTAHRLHVMHPIPVSGITSSNVPMSVMRLERNGTISAAFPAIVDFRIGRNSNVGIVHQSRSIFQIAMTNDNTGEPDTIPVTILSTGNVGIGTTTPENRLHIAGGGLNLQNGNTGTATTDQISFGFSANNHHKHSIRSRHNSIADGNDNALDFFIWQMSDGATGNASSRIMSITRNGVGIGTSTPTNTLDVQGNARITGGISLSNVINNKRLQLWEGANDHEFLGFGVNNNTLRYQVANGSDDHAFFRGNGASASVELMRIKGTGNVGIGTSAPVGRFHVNGGRIFIGDAAYETTSTSITGANAMSNMLVFDNLFDLNTTINASTPANKIRIHTGNNNNWIVGFGISNGAFNYHVGDNGNHVFWTGSSSSNYGTERMRINGAGNVGIGTSTPTYTLDVNGPARVNNKVTFRGNDMWAGTSNRRYALIATLTGSNSVTRIVLTCGGHDLNNEQNQNYIDIWINKRNLFVKGIVRRTGGAAGSLGHGLVIYRNTVNGNLSVYMTAGFHPIYSVDIHNIYDTTIVNSVSWSADSSFSLADNVVMFDSFTNTPTNTTQTNIYVTSSSATSIMTQLDNGNVGIGTSSPSERLHVNGKILASDDITAFSDSNYKTNLEPITNAMSIIENITGYKYNMINDAPDSKKHVGVLAQQVETLLPEVVHTAQDGKKSVAYGNMIALLIQGMKEMKKEIQDLKSIIGA